MTPFLLEPKFSKGSLGQKNESERKSNSDVSGKESKGSGRKALTCWVLRGTTRLWEEPEKQPQKESEMSEDNAAMQMPDFSLEDLEMGDRKAFQRIFNCDVKQIEGSIEKLKAEAKPLDSYADVQYLQLLKLQYKILSALDDDQKLSDASLKDLVAAFKALKDKELVSQGKPTEIVGLVGYLTTLEQEEKNVIDVTPSDEKQLDLFTQEINKPTEIEVMPCL